ncbi:hypothetical protein N7491_007874 [Penicillium cf. griseofulvum]|uniref:Uncharacterized protein n=1 Tax=Penicillium cf. griseofulvum TaxID=2972120 RepID=A0A9W9J4V8_9EURO|nr:hypothetical protein N7472_009097 [Penicillium cf. griseofulvum]KAJ5427432.1 hypothetical protein N7491_007874 [Penicillium cf. griseofulvum]KAJ5431632.1 hypothetical protein N7445_008130 [Penicillium cf. griseofulvum]
MFRAFQRLLDACRLKDASGKVATKWINDDLRPLPPSRRKWTGMTYLGWWSIWMMGLSNFQVGSSLVALNMSVWQAMVCVILGRIVIALVAILSGAVGSRWHIGFPVFSRVIWGMRGSYGAILLRILLGLVGFAVQSWNGGLCVTAVLSAIFPSYFHLRNTIPESSHVTTVQIIGWLVFLALSIPLIYVRPERASTAMSVMNVLTLITILGILIWALTTAHGAGSMLSESPTAMTSSQLGWSMLSGVNAVIGTVAPALMSQPDFSRFARRERDQVWGQAVAFVVVGTVVPLFGCLVSSATRQIYGEAIWNPPILFVTWLSHNYQSSTRAAAAFAGIGMTISQLAVLVVDNAYSVGIDLCGLFPTFLNIRRGAYLGLVLGMAFCPWELLSTAAIFLNVISGFTIFFGPICGIQICDYWVLRRRRIGLSALYHIRPDGAYYYLHGVNWRPVVAWVCGWATLLPGFMQAVQPRIQLRTSISLLYHIAFVLGLCISFLVHWGLNFLFPPPGLGDMDSWDEFGTFTDGEARALGLSTSSSAYSSLAEQTVDGNQVKDW